MFTSEDYAEFMRLSTDLQEKVEAVNVVVRAMHRKQIQAIFSTVEVQTIGDRFPRHHLEAFSNVIVGSGDTLKTKQ